MVSVVTPLVGIATSDVAGVTEKSDNVFVTVTNATEGR